MFQKPDQTENQTPMKTQKGVFGGALKMTITSSHFGKKREGLTLIELIVVIGLISLLLVLLMPGLKAARDSARTIKCVNNARQIIQASLLYAHDNNETFPPWYGFAGDLKFYPEKLQKYLGTSRGNVGWLTWVTRGPHKNNEVVVCPANMNGEAWSPVSWNSSDGTDSHAISYGYGMNFYVMTLFRDIGTLNDPNCDGRKLPTIINPSQKTGYACVYIESAVSGLTFGQLEPFLPGSPSYVHHGKSSVAFIDGHVQLMNKAELTTLPNWLYPD